MEKNAVISIRDALLNNNKHRAIRIAFDNGINVSLSSDLVIWDDDKEIIVAFTADGDSGSFEAGLPIRIICSTYENIQFIFANTAVKLKDDYKEQYTLTDLSGMIDSLAKTVTISDSNKEKIIEWYSKIYDYNKGLSEKAYKGPDIIRD